MPTDPWGITDAYDDARGERRTTPPATREAILAAMGAGPGAAGPPAGAPVRVVAPGRAPAAVPPGDLSLEDGSRLRVEGPLPSDLPLGYHDLYPRGGGEPVRIVVCPPACHLPEGLRIWGWAAQLYAVRSAESWGIGDLADLRRLARWSATELGAGAVLINPLNAPLPIVPQEPSPYFPSSRRYRNPIYLRIEEVPGARGRPADVERLAGLARALNADRRIDRDRVFRLKMEALEALWSRFAGDPGFERYSAAEGAGLVDFATFAALAEHHGRGWHGWPRDYRHPASPAVARFRAEHEDRVRFHQWLQWLADEQLRRAAESLPVIQDLPIGVDADGADAWAWQDMMALGVSVGAPPDDFSPHGQDWGLPPLIPHRLRGARYEPFIQTIRAALRHAGGLRIDHVMGLFRLFWIPRGMAAAEGAFVRYPVDDLLAIVALESHRAGAFVVGEDLGTVERGVRERLAAQRVLSYRLFWFESEPPARYPELALAAVTTHDLPTIAGLWTGADQEAQRALGWQPNEGGFQWMRARLREFAGVDDSASVPEVIERAYRLLAGAPSAVVTATLEDALAVPERPNLPGTTTERPNWSLALPVSLEELERHPLPRAIADALRDRAGAGAGTRR
jgi:4-alpha-glucanotransferase